MHREHRPWLTAALLLTAIAATAHAEDGAARAFADLERSWLEAPAALAFDITAEGAVSAHLEGWIEISSDDHMELVARGHFMDQKMDLELTADGQRLVGVGGQGPIDMAQPPALRQSLVLGFSRMGLLHNLARLTASRGPDHAEGGVAEWVRVEGFEARQGDAGDRGVHFRMVVAGQPAGEATLWLSGDPAAPTVRHQNVQFPQGEMRVVERYSPLTGER